MRSVMNVRGGEEESDDEEESDEVAASAPASAIDYAAIVQKAVDMSKDVAEVTKEKVYPVVSKYSKIGGSMAFKYGKIGAIKAKKTSILVYKALKRAISAAMEGEETDEEDDDEDGGEAKTLMDKVLVISKKSIVVAKRMVKAALTVPEDEVSAEDEEEEETEEKKEDEAKDSLTTETDLTDFGSYLAEAYGVDDMRKDGPTILGGSFQDALQIARQQARMLLVFIPSERPANERGVLSFFGGKKDNAEPDEKDLVAIESLLSNEVGKAANKKARKKSDLGSFAIWLGKAGSSEASSAMKKLKISAKGEKKPTMCVVYPSVPSGSSKVVPQVLAQHHCNPPLEADKMASWMNSLRKRHGKQYQSMQKDLDELKLYQERKEGYIESAQSDKERKIKEAKEAAERKAEEEKEAARQEEIDARRQELQQSLPEDIKKGNNVKKIALRFSDGRLGQRGFAPDQPLSVVFDWVDAMFEIERETVVLTTLNGKQTFSWESEIKSNRTLQDAGLNKMTAFRVTEA